MSIARGDGEENLLLSGREVPKTSLFRGEYAWLNTTKAGRGQRGQEGDQEEERADELKHDVR